MWLWLAFSALLSIGLAIRGLGRGSLSPSGAAAAAAVGLLHMASSLPAGTTLICFYLTSSIVSVHDVCICQTAACPTHRPTDFSLASRHAAPQRCSSHAGAAT